MGHIFERIIFDWYSCIREPNTFSVQSKKARKWDFSSNPLQNPWNPRISSTDYWRTDYWVGEVCRQIQTSLWNLHPKPFLASAFFGIIWQIKVSEIFNQSSSSFAFFRIICHFWSLIGGISSNSIQRKKSTASNLH